MQETVLLGFLWYAVFVFSTSAHEAAHALTAYLLGDKTAYHGGQVTLNPMPHIKREPLGMVVVPIITYAMGGWMMGWASTPYNPWWAERYPRRAAMMAFAGPSANLILVLIAVIVIRVGVAAGFFMPPDRTGFSHMVAPAGTGIITGVAALVSIVFSLNLLLFAFNLLPLPPLDGSAVLDISLSGRALELYKSFRMQPYATMIGIFVAWNIFGPVYAPIQRVALQLLYPDVTYR
jgi:Zn-dependent protease